MKKTWLYLSLSLNLILLVVLVICGLLVAKIKSVDNKITNTKNSQEIVEDVSNLSPEQMMTYQPQAISLEWMTLEEKNSFGINTSTESRIQVLRRDANGRIEDYKIIQNDKDIVTEF
ncbi:MAG: hypothetical protein Q7U54_04470 [Bacteroidales bacterium]|nr:hypothetical protein [Bacteroidales bacterium]